MRHCACRLSLSNAMSVLLPVARSISSIAAPVTMQNRLSHLLCSECGFGCNRAKQTGMQSHRYAGRLLAQWVRPPSHGLQSVGTHSRAQWPSAHLFPAWRMWRLWITLGWRWTSSKIFCEPTTDCQDGPELLHLLRRRLFLRGAGNAHRSSTCVSHRPGRSPNLYNCRQSQGGKR